MVLNVNKFQNILQKGAFDADFPQLRTRPGLV